MTYVIIQGRGLSGGVFCPPATGTRGMRDGQGPTLPWAYGGAFREFEDGKYRSEMIQRAEVAPTGMGGFRTRGPGIGLGAFGATETVTFEDGLDLARSALVRLSYLAAALQRTATSAEIKELARQAQRFADEAGPTGLTRARQQKSLVKLQQIQQGIANITRDAVVELRDSLMQRFLALVILPPGINVGVATMSSEEAGELREKLHTAGDGTGFFDLNKILFWLKVGAGVGGAVALAYVINSFRR